MRTKTMEKIPNTAQKMKFSIKDFCSKCDQTRSFQRIWSHLLKKSLMENFIFCAVKSFYSQPDIAPVQVSITTTLYVSY